MPMPLTCLEAVVPPEAIVPFTFPEAVVPLICPKAVGPLEAIGPFTCPEAVGPLEAIGPFTCPEAVGPLEAIRPFYLSGGRRASGGDRAVARLRRPSRPLTCPEAVVPLPSCPETVVSPSWKLGVSTHFSTPSRGVSYALWAKCPHAIPVGIHLRT